MKHKIENLNYCSSRYSYCLGILNVDIDGKHYTFEKPFWVSGGSVSITNDGGHYIEEGDWELCEECVPDNITREIAEEVIEAMNNEPTIQKGCCGGCI
jgi:hypothetical protein